MKIKQLNNLLKIGRLKTRLAARQVENLTDKFTLLNLLTLLGVLSTLTAAIWLLGRTPKEVKAGWYNDNWMYRKKIEITNNGSSQTDFQIDFTLNTSSLISDKKMQSDCDDIRITNSSGQKLPHWIPTSPDNATANYTCNSSTTKIWVKVPSVETSGGILYVYYGNPSAITSENGEAVFEYFDNFSNINFDSDWNEDSGIWTTETFDSKSTVSIETGSNNQFLRNISYNTNSSFILETSTYSTQSGDGQAHPGVIFYADNGYNDHIYWRPHCYNASNNIQVAYYNGSLNMAENFSGIYNWNEWLNTTVKVNNNSAEIIQNNSTKGTRNGLQYDGIYSNIGLAAHNSGKTYWDYFAIRKFASTEPTTNFVGSEEQSPGPVAYWKFDEGYGDTAHDSTQNANNGSLGTGDSAPEWQSKDMCISGKCLKFDGNNDYISAANDTEISDLSEVTVEAWINPKTSGEWRGIIGNEGSGAYHFQINTSNLLQFYVYGPGDDAFSTTNFSGTNLNKWYHVAGVYNGSTIKVYVNGVEEGSQGGLSGDITSSNDIRIGRAYSVDRSFTGFIDEVKIYPYARTAEEIKADYASQGSAHGSSAVLGNSSEAFLSKGLVGYWKMEETSSPALDSSGIGTTGAWQDTASSAVGKFGNGIELDGTGDFLSLADNAVTMSEDTPWTLTTWINADAFGSGNYPGIFGNNLSSGQYQRIQFANNSSELCVEDKNNTDGGCGKKWTHDMSTDTWHHLVIVNNGTNSDNLELFVDSNSKGTLSMALTEWEIRQIGGRGGSDHKLNGTLDEVRVYNRALSPKEVRDLYNWAPGPVAYYNFDEGSGTNLYDKSGNGNSSDSFGGDPTWTKGKYGNSLDFDDNDYARNNSFSIDSDPIFTVAGWFKKTANMNSSGAWGIGAGGTSRETISGWCNNGENIGIDLWGTSTYYVDEEYPLNDWVHITWVKTAATFTPSTLKIYVNGVERSLSISRDGSDTVNLSAGLTVGGIYASSSYNAPVAVDDFKIYNYARTQKQIVEDMNSGHPIGGSPVGSQASYWSFDEGYGDTAHDISGQGNNGQLGTGSSAPSWTNNGKFGKALSFNGSTTRVTVSDSGESPLDITDEITISTWLYPTSGTGKYPLYKLGAFEISWADSAYGGTKIGGSIWDANGNRRRVNSSDNYSYDQWYHVAVTAKKYDKHNLYINGSLVDSNDFNYSGIQETDNDLVIGDYQGGGFAFEGIIDEVKVYSSALSKDEVKLDYNQGKSTVMGALSTESDGSTPSNSSNREYCLPGDTSSCNPPIAEWKFDEKQGTDANDTSGNGNTGSLENMELSDWKSSTYCHSGSCLEFDGVNEYVNMPNVNPTSALTVSGWAKAPSGDYSGVWQLISKYSAYIIGDNNNVTGQVCFLIYDDTWYPSGYGSGTGCYTIADPEKWHYFVGTYDGSDIRFYVDGALKAENSHTGSINNDGGNLHIAHRETSAVGSNHFAGLIDDIKIYDYARTPAQVAWDYNRGKPVGWWKFDKCEGSTAYDSSSNGNNGAITIGGSGNQDTVGSCGVGNTAAAWYNGSDGKINASLNFDGNDDKVTVTDPAQGELDFGTDSDFSVFTWIKGTDSSGGVVTKREPSTLEGYRIYIFNGKPYSTVDSTGSDCGESTSVDTVNDGNWHQIGLVADRDSNVKFFTDGSLVHTCGTATNDGTVSNDEDLKFGTDRYDDQFWNGQIDDVRIYNYALTDRQVKNLYNAGSAVRFSE